MIHHTPECSYGKTGLNWSVNWSWKRFWFRLFYLEYDASNQTITSWYFRFRAFKWPACIFSKSTSNVIESFLWDRNLVVATREALEDYPKIAGYVVLNPQSSKAVSDFYGNVTELR